MGITFHESDENLTLSVWDLIESANFKPRAVWRLNTRLEQLKSHLGVLNPAEAVGEETDIAVTRFL